MTLHELQRRLTAFDIASEVQDSIVATTDAIAELNRGQMFIGKRSDGTEILPTYSDMTIEIKELKGQPSDRVTLRDTGDFQDNIFVDVNSESFVIDSSDEKTAKLEKKYGDKILGLSKESKSEEYIPLYFLPELQKRITGKLGFKFS